MKTRIGYDLANGDVLSAVFIARALERALRFGASDRWVTDFVTLDHLTRLLEGDVVIETRTDVVERVVLDLQHAVVSIVLERRHGTSPAAFIEVHAASRQAATLELARLKELLPRADEPDPNRIQVAFWYQCPNGASKIYRDLEASSWTRTSPNYPARTRRVLEPLVTGAAAVVARGRLILLHGPPGTGKTSALRSLALESRESVLVEYVLDPEALFGRDAGYFANVVFDHDGDEDHDARRTRLLVLEDCDELLSADAKHRAGQGLARLLNLVDGMIGQGLDVAVVITTNEPVGAFHPAVTRPGRCGAVVEFGLFDRDEAAEWLRAHGHEEVRDVGRMSLAELFAFGREEPRSSPLPMAREPIGFVTARRR